jgi:hypothetical protein
MRRREDPCLVRLDRVQVLSHAPGGGCKVPVITGYETIRDGFVRCQTSTGTYARCRELRSSSSHAQVFWQYQRRKAWLKPWKISLVPNDLVGLTRQDLQPILAHCRNHRLLVVEIAFDFSIQSGVDRDFVNGHGIFGKSRQLTDRGGLRELYYGSRKSGTYVRCYPKASVNAFRVEHYCPVKCRRESVG